MKNTIIIWITLLPVICFGKFGWSFSDYSIFAGQQRGFGLQPKWNFEFQFDKYSKSCIHQTHYFGIGVNYSFNDRQTEIGLKGMFNPTRFKLMLNRIVKFYPYLFGQGNYLETKSLNPVKSANKPIGSFIFRPGLGFSGNIMDDKLFCIRTSFQMGYNIPLDNNQLIKRAVTFEFKVGIGVNARHIKRKKKAEVINPEESK